MGSKAKLNKARKRIWEDRQKAEGVIPVELTPMQKLQRQNSARNNWKLVRR